MDFYDSMNDQQKNWQKKCQNEDFQLETEISPWESSIKHEFSLKDQPSYKIDSNQRLSNKQNRDVSRTQTKSPLKSSQSGGDKAFECSRYSQYWSQIQETIQKKQNRNRRNVLKATICKGKILDQPLPTKTKRKIRNSQIVPSWFQKTFFLSNTSKGRTLQQKIVHRQNQEKLPIINQYNLFRK